jgi:lipoprotein-anchoring transpeptidase ErfK/SrfK
MPTVKREMTNSIHSSRLIVAAALVVLAVAIAIAFAPGAGARATKTSEVDVFGSGTIVWRQVAALAKPSPGATRVAVLKQFRPDYRPQYVLALDVRRTSSGKPSWYRISIPGRPNGRTGWVRAAALELQPVAKRVVIYRGARKFEFWDGERLVRTGRVAVGARGAETPLGLFYVTDKFSPAIDPDWAILGTYAFETSAYSKLTDWPGGGIVGVHGTPWPHLLGQAVSHGCIRLHNDDVSFLRNRVPLGTPVKIVR